MLKNFPSVIKQIVGLLLAVKLRKEYQRGNPWEKNGGNLIYLFNLFKGYGDRGSNERVGIKKYQLAASSKAATVYKIQMAPRGEN